MVSTSQRLVMLITVVGGNCGAGISGIVGWADTAVGVASISSESTCSGHFGITDRPVLAAALPELDTTASSVVVGRARTEALLLAVVARKSKLDQCGDQEEEAA